MGDTSRGPYALRLELVRAGSGAGDATLWALSSTGEERRLAAWAVGPEDEPGMTHVEVVRSPTGRRAAARVGDEAWTFALADGSLVAHTRPDLDVEEPVSRTLLNGSGRMLAWDEDERAACVRGGRDRTLRVLLAEGVVLTVTGPVEDDGGEASSSSSAGSLYFARGTSPEDMAAELARQQSAAEREVRADIHVRVAVARGDREVLVHEDTSSPSAGFVRLQWPVLAGPRGVLLRRSWAEETAGPPAQGRAAVLHGGNEVGHPWLVTAEGEVVELPFALGNGPLTTLPDGRFLLPCWAAMWWDAADEALTALSDDGETEPLLLDGQSLTPSAVVSAFDPSLVVPRASDYDHDDAWTVAGARVDGDGTLVLALQRGCEPGDPWLIAAMPLDGLACGPPRLVASGTAAAATTVRVAV